MKTHTRLLVALASAFALTVPSLRAWAQYMYLDANGDGVSTREDVLNPAGEPTTVTVYLDTSRNADSSVAYCTTGSEALSIVSYEFILHASGGTVSFGKYTNLRSTMNVSFGSGSSETDFYAGFGGAKALDPGLYHLGSLSVTVEGGSPTLEPASMSTLDPHFGTSFGTQCLAADGDNTYKLGLDWYGIAGCGSPGSARGGPNIPSPLTAAASCFDSTGVPLFGWDIPGDGSSIAIGTNGFVYVADPIHNQICRYSLNGSGEMCWGSPGITPPEPGAFYQPRWLAWNPKNNRLYISGTYSVAVYDPSGNFDFDIKGDSVSTEPGNFAGAPGAVAIDPRNGFAWVHESNYHNDVFVDRLQEVDLSGHFTGRVLNRDTSCKMMQSFGVEDMAVDSTGSVYMLDHGWYISEVHRYDPGVGCGAHWGHEGVPVPGELSIANSLAIDKDGFICVLDWTALGHFVRKYDRSGVYISSIQIGLPGEQFSSGLDFMHNAAGQFMYVAPFGPNRVEVFGDGIEAMNILETPWVDPSTFRLKTSDLDLLAACPDGPQDNRKRMKGVAADGVSPLLLRLHLPESGTVRWKLSDPQHVGVTENLGSLSTLDSAMTGLVVDTSVESVGGEYIAFAVYTAPIDFERSSVPADTLMGERPLRLTAKFTPDIGADSVDTFCDLTIERPTVVFLHGFLGNSGAWNNFKSIRAPADTALWGADKHIVVDYSETSGKPLATNARVLGQELASATASARARRIASAQVDIISHSMGGLVLRRLADAGPQDPFTFRNPINMGRGYYHKAMFLDVPHQGSFFADIAVKLRDVMNDATVQPPLRQTARWLLERFAKAMHSDLSTVTGGAIDDMRPGSAAVTGLQQFTAPTHSHVGVGGSDLWSSAQLLASATADGVSAFIQLVATFTSLPELNALLPPNEHDVAVPLDSQVGGLSNPSHYVKARLKEGLHGAPLSSNIAGNVARDWARRPVEDAAFFASSLPGGASFARSPGVSEEAKGLAEAVGDEISGFAGVTLRFTEPVGGGVLSGDSILVAVQAFSDVEKAIVTYPGGAVFLDSTLTAYVHTDKAYQGPFELMALALMADGTMGRSEPVTMTVGGPSVPNGIEVTPASVSLSGVGGLLELRVVGDYSDGVQRDIATSAFGTTYTGFNTGIVSVSQDGVLRGSGAGMTTVTVQNGTLSQVVTVEVGSAPLINNSPHANAGGPYQICNGEAVHLSASGSIDFDGGPLTYTWDLNGDGQFGDMSGASVYYTPPFIADERLIGLRVTDPAGATSEDYTTIQVPLNCFGGVRTCVFNVGAFGVADLSTDGSGDVYMFDKFDTFGHVERRTDACAPGAIGYPAHSPADLEEFAVDSSRVAYVIGPPADEAILRFGPGSLGELSPLASVSTTPYSLVTGIAVDRDGSLYGSDYDPGTQHVFIRKFDQAAPIATLLTSWDLTLAAGVVSAESLSVAVAPDSAIFVAVRNEILKGVPHVGGYVLERRWGSFGFGAGQFRGISDVALGPDGDVYVTDYGNHRIQRFASDGTFRSMRKKALTNDGKFYHPTGVTVLDDTRVAVADLLLSGQPRVQILYWGDAVPTSVLGSPPVVRNALGQNYPNPFNPTTTIAFSVAENGHVLLAIYDVRGRLVRTLVNEPRGVGSYRAVWDGKTDTGTRASSGVYFYRVSAGRFQSTKKMLLLK